jgi:uncharacterized protein YuzE
MNERIRYDAGSDTLYLLVKEGYEEQFVEVADGIGVELDDEGHLLGIEILNASRLLPLVMEAQRPSQPQSLATAA